jgi:hypothetical protein
LKASIHGPSLPQPDVEFPADGSQRNHPGSLYSFSNP